MVCPRESYYHNNFSLQKTLSPFVGRFARYRPRLSKQNHLGRNGGLKQDDRVLVWEYT